MIKEDNNKNNNNNKINNVLIGLICTLLLYMVSIFVVGCSNNGEQTIEDIDTGVMNPDSSIMEEDAGGVINPDTIECFSHTYVWDVDTQSTETYQGISLRLMETATDEPIKLIPIIRLIVDNQIDRTIAIKRILFNVRDYPVDIINGNQLIHYYFQSNIKTNLCVDDIGQYELICPIDRYRLNRPQSSLDHINGYMLDPTRDYNFIDQAWLYNRGFVYPVQFDVNNQLTIQLDFCEITVNN